ncbi:hypothetical protein F3Y22_tig00110828pilonHSYRG00080 [Hibiscus syriacus]|uniref:Protein kinase domain-containing protein n=2 Tax=Hibiscus syriacus TaxID=106335 RepID=A0A6A2ZNZ0_HIBSY|nr:hypothetical protein F3Y22_tig00110828pilonHSYRG00080 [Hibiscus syriacus]
MPDFREITTLRSLYLSNAFRGLVRMMKLYLSENRFTGKIPSSMLGPPRLKELKLDWNQFSGRIPDFQQTNLQVANLSDNELDGPTPEKLRKMDASTFSGNEDLFGPPLKTECNPPSPSPSPSTVAPSAATAASLDPTKTPSSTWLIIIIFLAGTLFIFSSLTLLLLGQNGDRPPSSVKAPPLKSKKKTESVKLCFLMDNRENFDLMELLKSSAEVLGSGSFGASYKVATPTGPTVVVKRFQQMNNATKDEFHQHMRSLGSLRHDNLLPIIAYFYQREEKLIVSDFVHTGSLAVHLHC